MGVELEQTEAQRKFTCAKCGREWDVDVGSLILRPPDSHEYHICIWCLCETFGIEPQPKPKEAK